MEINYKQIFSRLKHVKNFRNDTELAEFLGVTRDSIYMTRKRNSGNLDQILTHCTDIDLNWLVFGKKLNFENQLPDSDIFREMLGIAKRNGELEKENEMLKAELAQYKGSSSSGKKMKAA